MTPAAGITGAVVLLAGVVDKLGSSIITLGAVAIALPAIWRYLIKPGHRALKQVGAVHTVILGNEDEGVPSLTERLAAQDSRLRTGDADFDRIEAKVDELREDIAGDEGVLTRVGRLERILDVLGSEERLEIRTIIHAAFKRAEHGEHPHRRRISD